MLARPVTLGAVTEESEKLSFWRFGAPLIGAALGATAARVLIRADAEDRVRRMHMEDGWFFTTALMGVGTLFGTVVSSYRRKPQP